MPKPFDTGTQYADWTGSNCDRCTKFTGYEDMPTCEIDLALLDACLSDGNVSDDIARRMGYTEHRGRYVWPCGEVQWTEEWKAEYADIQARKHQLTLIEEQP